MMAYGFDCPLSRLDSIVNLDGIHWRLGNYILALKIQQNPPKSKKCFTIRSRNLYVFDN